MSLQTKAALLLTVVFAAFIVIDVTLDRIMILPRFEALEDESTRREMARCYDAIQRELEYLALFCRDWAVWDDTYDFVESRDSAYVNSNLDLDPASQSMALNLMAIINLHGEVAWGRGWDFVARSLLRFSEFPAEQWPKDHPLIRAGKQGQPMYGIVSSEAGPLAIAAHPILPSDERGPVRGVFVMGTIVSGEVLDNLAARTGVPFHIQAKGDSWPPAGSHAVAEIDGRALYVNKSTDTGVLVAHLSFPDLYGGDTFQIQAPLTFPHAIYVQGEMALGYWSRFIAVVGIVVLALAVYAMRALITQPLSALAGHITTVAWDRNLEARLPVRRNDEIGSLARAFNEMLERIAAGKARYEAADRELRESESRVRAILTTAPDGILTLDRDARILSSNPAAQAIFRVVDDEWLGQPMKHYLPGIEPLLTDRTSGSDNRPAPTTDATPELYGQRADGVRFPVDARVSAHLSGDDVRFTLIVRDISSLKRLHEEVSRNERLAAIGEMSTAIAHEIKNPLAAISGTLQVIKHDLEGSDPRREIFDEMLLQTRRLDKAVRDLLMFARPWTPDLESCSLQDIVSRAIEGFYDQPGSNEYTIVQSGTTEHLLEADVGLLQQVLWNLLHNAAQAMPGGGTIRCTLEERDGRGIIQVADAGRGIAAEDLDRVFQPFFSTKTRGTGLGLAVCRKVMEAHGGEIRIVDTGPAGTIMEISLPLEGHHATTHSGR